jgi:hypothetical protein
MSAPSETDGVPTMIAERLAAVNQGVSRVE